MHCDNIAFSGTVLKAMGVRDGLSESGTSYHPLVDKAQCQDSPQFIVWMLNFVGYPKEMKVASFRNKKRDRRILRIFV